MNRNSNSARAAGIFSITASVLAIALAATIVPAIAQDKPIKIGVVTFLSGAAAGPFGVPAETPPRSSPKRSTPASYRRRTPPPVSAARLSKSHSSTKPAARPSRSTNIATWSSATTSTW